SVKVKRHVVAKQFGTEIDKLYEEAACPRRTPPAIPAKGPGRPSPTREGTGRGLSAVLDPPCTRGSDDAGRPHPHRRRPAPRAPSRPRFTRYTVRRAGPRVRGAQSKRPAKARGVAVPRSRRVPRVPRLLARLRAGAVRRAGPRCGPSPTPGGP